MASCISGLSLFILVLINGCFTLPIGEIQFPDFTASPFYNDFTTEKNFKTRGVADSEVFTTPFGNIQHAVHEDIFPTETNPTVATNIKRSLSEPAQFDVTAATDVSRQERFSEEPFSFTDSATTELFTTVSQELDSHHDKRGMEVEDATMKAFAKSNQQEVLSPFTTNSIPLFTSTSSAVAPKLYTTQSSVLSELRTTQPTKFNSIRTSTGKYVGSLVDPAENQDVDESPMEKPQKPKKANKPVEEEQSENLVDTKKKPLRQNTRPTPASKTSVDPSTGEKYIVGELLDQDSWKFHATIPSNIAYLDESAVAVTLGSKTRSPKRMTTTTTTPAWNEDNKLNQGEESA